MLTVYSLQSTAKPEGATAITEADRQKSEDKIKNGFTLAEILVVMAITAIIGTVLVTIFANTLRGSNKSQILANIKQNGQAVLDNIDKNTRGADDICVSNGGSGNTLVVVNNGSYIRYRFVPPDNVNAAVGNCGNLTGSANGCIQQDNPIQPPSPAPKSDIKVFIDSLCQTDTDLLTPPVVTLTDTNTQSGVSVECIAFDCVTNPVPVFKRDKLAGFKDQVIIRFNLKPAVGALSTITSQIDPVAFQTTVQLR